jgi:hypothetical protein
MTDRDYVKVIMNMSLDDLRALFLENINYVFVQAILARLQQLVNIKKDQVAHVICMNDSPMHVSIGSSEDAENTCVKMQRDYYDKNKGSGRWNNFDNYCNSIFWYIRDVKCSFNIPN